MKSIRNSVRILRSAGLILLMVMTAGVFSYVSAQHVTMSTANCTATSTYVEFDVTVVNDGTVALAFNSTTIRIALPSSIINTTDACTVSYQGSSEFPLLFTTGNNQSYTASSRLITATTSPSQYTSATAISLPIGVTKTIARYRVTKNSGTFTANASGAMVWNTTSDVVLYVNGASTTTNFNSTTNRTLATPCTLTIPSACTAPSLSATTTDVTCNGGSDGAIDLTTTGGSSPFTYAWTKTGDGSFSAATQDLTGLTAGTYNVTVTASGGCTTSASYTVTQPAALSSIVSTVTACGSYTWSVNGQTYTSSGTYNATIGCQPYTLNLTINTGVGWGNLQFPGSSNVPCGGSLTAYGQVYKAGVTEAAGQGSGITAEIGYSTTNTDPSTWTNWSPATFNVQVGNNDEYTGTLSGLASGTYYYTFRYKYGTCDYQYGGYDALGGGFWNGTQYVSGVLTIASGSTNTTNASACDSYTWSVNGQTYTSSGTYTFTSGCNTEVLNLTITPSTSNTASASSCDSYTWSVNGVTYTSSGTYTYTSGCHTEVLNLTITPSTSNTTNTSACDSYTWSVNGQTYTSSGTYTYTSGCHTEVLNLTITPSTSNTTNASSCDSYTWSVNGQTYTSSGTYTSTSGCHTEVLNLTITPSTSNTTNASSCGSYTWSVNGVTYTSSGTYTYTSGCHTEVLNLTITASTSNTTTATACNSYTWSVNGVTYTSSGTYTYTSGCHTEVLNLTITTGLVPGTPGVIQGQRFNLCNSPAQTYTLANPAPRATSYTWTVPSGYTILSGQGTTSILLQLPASPIQDTISVVGNNACGTGAKRILVLRAKPSQPVISGPACVNANQSGLTYTVTNPEPGVTYTWKVPGQARITAGQGTTSVTVDWKSTSGTISCMPNNSCDIGARGSYAVTVGCASAVTASNASQKVTVYPNPTFGLTNVIFTVSKETKYAIVVTDMAGKRLQQKELVALPGQNKITLDLGKYSSGIYTVNLISADGTQTVKVVKGQ
mgnify:CR=1 FL=1